MKKKIILLMCILTLTGCGLKKDNTKKEDESTTTTTTETTTTVPAYVDDNIVTVGLYDWNSSNTKRVLVKGDYTNKWIYYNDILVFNVLYTNEDEADGTRIAVAFDKYRQTYNEDVTNYKVGFKVKFNVGDTTIEKTLLRPSDTESFFDYLEVYLYDGYHRASGEWYSHTTEDDFTEDTIFTSIKLTTGKQIESITSDIELTAFTYNGTDDFDEDGNYRGNSSYTVTIHKAN